MTSRYTDYNNWAWLYNETMGPEYSRPQLDFLSKHFLPQIPTGGHILDLCCGTGQLIGPLLSAGYQVTGLDGSEDMLNYAKQNSPNASYLAEDARTFNLPNQFAGVFSTSASLNHIMSLADLSKVFTRVYAALCPDGLFAFDLNHPTQLERWWRSQPTEGEISRHYAWMITPHYDSQLSQGNFTVTIYQDTRKRASYTLLQSLRQRLYRFLSHPRFIGLRLRLLQNLSKLEPKWEKKNLVYPVKGHNLSDVRNALYEAGFDDVVLTTIDGSSDIDSNHSAHFIAKKDIRKSAYKEER